VLDDAGSITAVRSRVGSGDGERLDDFAEAVRETEQRLLKAKAWEDRPKPKVDAKPPGDVKDRGDVIGRARLMYDVMHLALRTDSTRLITLYESGANAVPPSGVSQDYHNPSHHGMDGANQGAGVIETEQMKAFGGFLAKLKSSTEGEGSLLTRPRCWINPGREQPTAGISPSRWRAGFKHVGTWPSTLSAIARWVTCCLYAALWDRGRHLRFRQRNDAWLEPLRRKIGRPGRD
jgi:hypothetical protein